MGKRFKTEEIVMKLREAEILLGKGMDITSACRQIGISDQTYYRWRREYGGLQLDQAKKYKELERENTQLKKLVADQALDIAILKEVQRGNF
jgi:transposase-like protein